MKPKNVPVATLIEDFALYPRNKVDESHVSDLARALQADRTLPPIIADADSKRIVDGFHRRRAYIKVFGDEATAPVEFRKYESDAELFLDAVELNAAHGRKLDRHDQTRIVLRLRELKVPDQQIAIRLHVPEPTVQLLAIRVVMTPDGHAMPSKRGLEWCRGTTMSAEQITTIDSVRSAEPGRLCLELTRLLATGLVDLENPTIVAQLRILADALHSALADVAA